MKVFHSDNGSVFINTRLHTYLQDQGVLHQLNCPHTVQQLGIVERRHRSVVELGITQLFKIGVSPKY